jgi:HJR/Mrr/RecB family endonuclease
MVRETVSNRVYREIVSIGVNVDICESAGVVTNSSRELNSAGEIKAG